ncbi:MAG TPA: MFS transporter [Candidatus Competibacteraceae bacterium]|mgnify:FL=1|nr:MFS transporter [Candidatus Competibacteraceae bacterium]MCP5134701.1 MFS transporter [Gammaproteobacteria bacterium]HPF58884.1 MFS transporter [Candidatus Competibacteraceae bacterium]HRY18025.1 MFS transporter [Candidatus Competibacteraceae bacterium]
MSASNEFILLKERRFLPFFITQFLGAFNDNVFKNALIILIAFQATDPAQANVLINASAGLFVLPFFLFSATAGQLADKYEKSRLMQLIKLLEILIMLAAAMAFILGSLPLLIGLLFLMGWQSTLFGPVKYSILPQHLKPEELVGGNGWVEMGTFLAILIGTLLGGVLIAIQSNGAWLVAGTIVILAVLGFISSLFIPQAAPDAPDLRINWNPITETWRTISIARRNRTVFLSVLGISWFWFLGATYLAQLPNYTKLSLGGDEHVVTLLLTTFALGIGIGSMLCERLSGRRVELGLVPFGSIGLTVFGVDLFFAGVPVSTDAPLIGALEFLRSTSNWRVLLDVLLMGMFGGFYIVPLYALVQQRSEPGFRSRVIAGNNIINALFMVLSALLAIIFLDSVGLSIPQFLLLTAIFNAVVAVYIFTLVPEFLMRFIVWILVNTVYRLRTVGLEHIPEEGPVVVVCNHVSYMDALIVIGCCRRPIRFVMDYQIFKIPVLSFVFRTAGAIPIAPARENAKVLERAYEQVARYLEDGEVVGIFPEGKLTGDGEIGSFKNGVQRIIRRNPAPVVPMALRGLWGSFFSRYRGKAMSHFPRRFWSRIELIVSEPVAPEQAATSLLRETVIRLRGDDAIRT